MWIIAFFLSMVLASGTGKTSAPRLRRRDLSRQPRWICSSDPELMTLADERQECPIAKRATRIGEQAWPALWEDPKALSPSLLTATAGVPPDTPPPRPRTGFDQGVFLNRPGRRPGNCLSPGLWSRSRRRLSHPAALDTAPSGRVGPRFRLQQSPVSPLTFDLQRCCSVPRGFGFQPSILGRFTNNSGRRSISYNSRILPLVDAGAGAMWPARHQVGFD